MTVKLHSSFVAAGVLSIASAFAQQTIPPAITPPPNPTAPAPIEPPIALPTAPGVPAPTGIDAVPPLSAPGGINLPPTSTRINEFQGDEIGLVLRTLARQAKMNVVISDKVATTAGTVTMRIEDKTAREAIEIIVNSKGLIMDDQGGVFYIKTQEEKAKEPAFSASYTFSYAQAKDVLPLLQSQLQSGLAPQFDLRTNTIFYRETKSNLEKVSEFLVAVDKPTQQVMIEARLVEVNANPQQSYGINWAGTFGSASGGKTVKLGASPIPQDGKYEFQTGNDGSVQLFDTLTGGTGQGGVREKIGANLLEYAAGQFSILSAPQVSATLRLLNEDKDAEFIANPRIVTANNQKAEIKIIRQQPVPQLNFNEQTAQAVFSGFQDKEFGNTLNVTPIINKDVFITLAVKPEISNKVADATFTFA